MTAAIVLGIGVGLALFILGYVFGRSESERDEPEETYPRATPKAPEALPNGGFRLRTDYSPEVDAAVTAELEAFIALRRERVRKEVGLDPKTGEPRA